MLALLRQGIDESTFLDPLFSALPPPSPGLEARVDGVRPRAAELILDSRNPDSVHIVRRWTANGDPIAMAFGENPLCSVGTDGVLAAAVAAIGLIGMLPGAVENPLVLADPGRPAALSLKQGELTAALAVPGLAPGDALALVCNALWELGMKKVDDLLALVLYQHQFSTQRGPSYDVMTGDPAFATSTCYRANSCEIMFDAADSRYVDFVEAVAAAAPKVLQAGYISLRYSRRSDAPLSMHHVASPHAVSIEISTLRGLANSASWVETALTMARDHGGRPHWGQQNHPTPPETAGLYGASLTVWQEILGALSGGDPTFSSAFTVARGLEPSGTRPITTVGTPRTIRNRATASVLPILLDKPRHRRHPAPLGPH